MAVHKFPETWQDLIDMASRLDDSLRRLEAEKRGWKPNSAFAPKQNSRKTRNPDEIDWEANALRPQRPRKGQKASSKPQKKKGACFNCGKQGHFAAEYRSKPVRTAKG